jgi:hypothetical protein
MQLLNGGKQRVDAGQGENICAVAGVQLKDSTITVSNQNEVFAARLFPSVFPGEIYQ